jgi:hypothetical protein
MNVHEPREPDLVDPLVDEERARGTGRPERDVPDRATEPPRHPNPVGTEEVPPPPSIDRLT